MKKMRSGGKTGTASDSFLPVETVRGLDSERRKRLMTRSTGTFDRIRPVVEGVIRRIIRHGDRAMLDYTRKFDGVSISQARIRVSEREIRQAVRFVRSHYPGLVEAMKTTRGCIESFHRGELSRIVRPADRWERSIRLKGSKGCLKVGQIRRPLQSVGVYVPGGNAVLITTALMTVVPARLAGVPTIVLASPPSRNGDIDPRLIAAASIAGADIIIRAGGAQAVAAMACGTKSVPKVCKIVGPGNIFVAAAKSLVANMGLCAIDFPAGPSEVLILADESANPEFAAGDMLSQAEHDANACSVLVTTSRRLAERVRNAIVSELSHPSCSSPAIAERSLATYGAILVAESLDQAVDFSNEFAPEHLEIMTRHPHSVLKKIRNAGGIFLGHNTPTAIGDYVCPNHVLPTGGAARFSSGLSVDQFMKKPAVLEVSTGALEALDALVETLSKAEGLYAQHGKSVHIRAKSA